MHACVHVCRHKYVHAHVYMYMQLHVTCTHDAHVQARARAHLPGGQGQRSLSCVGVASGRERCRAAREARPRAHAHAPRVPTAGGSATARAGRFASQAAAGRRCWALRCGGLVGSTTGQAACSSSPAPPPCTVPRVSHIPSRPPCSSSHTMTANA